MAAQQGFVYEENSTKFLKKLGLSDGITAGASHTRPDLMLTVRGKEAGCELKISPTAGGSLVIKAYANSSPHWRFGEIDHDETEKQFLADLAKSSGALNQINQKWETPIYNVADRTAEWERQMVKTPLRERYQFDLKTCPDIKMVLPSDSMTKYYNLKKTYYLNVGTHGFYLLGNHDPLGLNARMKELGQPPVPKFEDVCKITARVRCQSKGVTKAEAEERSKGRIGGQGYQFTFTIEFALPKNSSPYNISPIDGKTVTIQESKANIKCLL
ncbi:MAG: hypothetical protein ACYDG4_14775 [Desulfuromonadaceae bacterium]